MSSDYDPIARAIEYLGDNYLDQPDLAAVAAAVGLSPFHFQRLFQRFAGVSPKRFVQYLTARRARAALEETRPVLEAAWEAGLSGPGRLHDLMINVYAMTPGEVKSRALGMVIRYGRAASPFGDCLLAASDRGICHLAFPLPGDWAAEQAELEGRWPGAIFQADDRTAGQWAERVFGPDRGRQATEPIGVMIKGTNFQIRVWRALLAIPPGALTTYSDVAAAVGNPKAVRAAASAVAANRIGYLIPCHRVIRKTGLIADYHWGRTRKKAIIAWEAARRDERSAA